MAVSALRPRGANKTPKRPPQVLYDRGRLREVEGAIAGVRSSVADVDKKAADALDALGGLSATTPQIIGSYTVDTLPTPAGKVGKYARVTDLFGDKVDLVLASQSGSMTYWQPVRPGYAGLRAVGSMAFEALKMPSSLILSGTVALGITRTITLGTVTAFPGASLDLRFTGSLLGALNVAGLGLGSAVSILAGSYRKFVCVVSNGVLEWRQIV